MARVYYADTLALYTELGVGGGYPGSENAAALNVRVMGSSYVGLHRREGGESGYASTYYIDVFNYNSGAFVSSIYTGDNTALPNGLDYGMDAVGNYFVVVIAGRLKVIKVNGSSLSIIANVALNFPNYCIDIKINTVNGLVYIVTNLNQGLEGPSFCEIWDMSNPYIPVYVSTISVSTPLRRADINGTNLLLSGSQKIYIYDVLTPSTPVLLDSYDTTSFGSYAAEYINSDFFVAVCSDGWRVFSASETPESSSSLSSQSEISSSSSSSFVGSRGIYASSIYQEHNNLIPFNFIAESGISLNSQISFEIDAASNKYFDYDLLIGNAVSNVVTYPISTYVPEDDSKKIKHEPMFYVDIISKDSGGVKDYSLRSQKEIYGFETPTDVYILPKFTWTNELVENNGQGAVATDNLDNLLGVNRDTENSKIFGSAWIGTQDNRLIKIEYGTSGTDEIAEIFYTANTTSSVHDILFHPTNSASYITQVDNLTNYDISDYIDRIVVVKTLESPNPTNDIFALARNNELWTTQSYSGKITLRDPLTHTILQEYSGFDAPFKMLWSDYHGCYFIAGTNILWSLTNGIKKAVYEIKGYNISDFDCAISGEICLLLSGENNNLIRVLGRNTYSILVNEIISDGSVRYCKYCPQGIFYILVEVSTGTSYNIISYVYNLNTKIIRAIESSSVILTTTTTTTLPVVTTKMQLDYPVGREVVQKGSTLEIKWESTGSRADKVKLELYKSDQWFYLIESSTDNTGIYQWLVPTDFSNGDDYKIKATWIGTTDLPENSDLSPAGFTLTDVVQTTTTTTTQVNDTAIGIDYSEYKQQVVIVLRKGAMGFFDIASEEFHGLLNIDIGSTYATCMAVRKDLVDIYSNVTKIRVFVGSQKYLSNMWDSGVIETSLNSTYYGGGNNLIPGEIYFVNIQVFDAEYGWGEIQTHQFTMPR